MITVGAVSVQPKFQTGQGVGEEVVVADSECLACSGGGVVRTVTSLRSGNRDAARSPDLDFLTPGSGSFNGSN